MKIKLSIFARDLNISTADLLQFFYEKGDNRKKAASALTVDEADWILEKITQDNMVESFDDYFAYSRRDCMFVIPGEKLNCTIVSIDDREVIVDFGTEYTGYINWVDLSKDPSEYNIGDEIEAVVYSVNNTDCTAELIERGVMEQRHKLKHQKHQQNTSSVADEVISQVQEKLAQMKPTLISEVAISVYSQLEKGIAAENAESKIKVNELEERVKYLETLVDKLKLR